MSERPLPPRYTSVTPLASGGMGDVYSAVDELLSRTVAVKVLAQRHALDPDIRARFTREARAAARLSAHPNVVTVFDVGEHEGRPYLVMEYLPGGSVHDRTRARRIAPAQALEWLREAASALDAAHAQGVVHRDVKPANLLLDAEERVHVTDFGIASAAGFDTLTLPGMVLGTAGYLSPEQARGEAATAASDRYALGVVAFELLTGRRPYESDTPMTEAFAHVGSEIPSAELTAPALPRGVDAVFERALAKDPADRPRTSTELVDELAEAFRAAEPTTAVLPAEFPPPSTYRRRRRRSRVWLAAAAVAALLLTGFAAASLVGRHDTTALRTVTRVHRTVSTVSDTATTLTVTETQTLPASTSSTSSAVTTAPASGDGAALNDAGYRRMQKGDYAGALPLLEQAVSALAGSGSLAEAYASYNLAFTRFALGRCDGVLELLDRSAEVQGHRSEIDRLRKSAKAACEGPGRGKAKGNDNGD